MSETLKQILQTFYTKVEGINDVYELVLLKDKKKPDYIMNFIREYIAQSEGKE